MGSDIWRQFGSGGLGGRKLGGAEGDEGVSAVKQFGGEGAPDPRAEAQKPG